ncbi:PHP domain-containing protein [archaeon]|jgi:predicted metal-dependent phosphoesterase TrpH|nr:PHP domain-containing protein [archaeon]MBT3720512.1 PHP domain-containing protein [archaeon]MBT4022223.1 PHP domain-containing protein [archaeon]MBT4272836.1 PHP domain-containing protein [archaeon]MBT4461636.1 PHP domain-containing protein [archaeon]
MNNIRFENAKPIKGYKCVDMHYHTTFSDGTSSTDEILKKIRKKGIGVSITDHTEIKGSVEIFKKKKESDFIIPGIEVMSKKGFDVLFYFYDVETLVEFYKKEIEPYKDQSIRNMKTTLSFMEIVSLRKKYKCIASLAHPFGYTIRAKPLDIENQGDIFSKVDAIEVINGSNNPKLNIKALDLQKKTKLGYTGGSDGHCLKYLGNTLTCVKARNIKEFLDGIKQKKCIVIGREPRLGRNEVYFYYFFAKLKQKWNSKKT